MAKAKYTKQSNGYFQTRVWDGTYSEGGKKNYITLRSKKSSKDLEEKVNEHNNAIKERQYVRKTDASFIEYSKAWYLTYKSSLELNGKNMYLNTINKHFKLLTQAIGDTNRSHYITTINSISGTRSKQIADMTFKQIIKSAIRDKLLPASVYDEIFEDAPKIKYKAPEKRPLHDYEKKALSKANFEPMDKAYVFIIFGCGLRRGEAIALSRFDISLERKEISINKAIAFDENNPVLKDTKNYVHRIVPIPDATFPFIEEYVKSLKGTYLFPGANTTYISKSSFDKMWRRIIKAMQAECKETITGLTSHIFRHNYCASLCKQFPAISIKKIAELLGDSEKMVLEVYNHEIEGKIKPIETITKALAL
ncbi:MAG: site-specific integrase [Lachnospiraceae bacterium]|nr:site-specific integrase [Lachnospiraceae bacterium]